ncbi:G patch domain-containing protein 1 homolog [Zerene cesonia]|uniref:G patch domain-containing protein 1 homolog n=1 Tax=Zerene cesonia TaxID=33412 RepID=UPI0018E53922|nr:G patch domain-containing protein 1 homolog [Zerene cesonia]
MTDSDSEDENIIRYGTPLEPYEEDEIPSKRKYQQPADQYAVDDHGRRRFHGAFTGGFSAGYGNTVGTPEGWSPATFKSSRSEKAQRSSQRPEDFMDEEDRSEFGIAPKQMQTHGEFSGQKRSRQNRFHDGPIPGEPVLEQLLRPIHESAAVKMLRAMGWREGQGTGERLTKAEKKKTKKQHKVYGCYMPPDMRQENQQQSEESSDSEFEYETLFAPDDYEPYILQPKNDRFGLGYSGLSRHSVLGNLVGEYGSSDTRSHLVMKEKGKKVSIRGQAFGVGAFEADDEDIYANEDMSHYDFAIGGAIEKSEQKKPKERASNVLPGFVKASKPLPKVPSFPPPVLPRDYKPAPAGIRRTRFEATSVPQRDQALGRHELSAEARGALLGETPVPPPKETPQNVETKPKEQTQDAINKLFGKNVNFVSTNEKKEETMPDFISIKDSGRTVTPVFKPFASDPKKQARYERFLVGGGVGERDGDMGNVGAWERDREMLEFEQAAKLYRPLSGVMGDRFTHATQPDEALNPLCAVAKSSTNYGLATPEMEEAAKKGAFGVMTRRKVDWRPESIVCKRFNIPELGGNTYAQQKEDKPKVSYSIFSYMESSVHDKDSFTKEQTKFSGSKSLSIDNKPQTKAPKVQENTPILNAPHKRMTVAELFLKESERDMQNKETPQALTETIEKFDKMDLYKAIFLSDSENDDDKKTDNDFIENPKNVERNTSPPRGIFANIDFDEINSWRRAPKEKEDKKDAQSTDNKDADTGRTNETDSGNKAEPEVYGPQIPVNLQRNIETNINESFKPKFRSKEERKDDSDSSSDSWVDAKEVKHKKHKKKSKKHKSKHKKSKHKKKDK